MVQNSELSRRTAGKWRAQESVLEQANLILKQGSLYHSPERLLVFDHPEHSEAGTRHCHH